MPTYFHFDDYLFPVHPGWLPRSHTTHAYHPRIPPDRPSSLRTRLASVYTRALSSDSRFHTHPWPYRLSCIPR